MKKTTAAIAGAALIVAGIAGFGIAQAATGSAPNETPSVSAVDPTVTARDGATVTQPSATQVATAKPNPTTYTEVADAQTVFLHAMRNDNGGLAGMADVSDAELIGHAHKACDDLAAGAEIDSVNVIVGQGTSELNNRNLVGIASETYCTEWNQQLKL